MYRYFYGFNLRALGAWLFAFAPNLPSFAHAVNAANPDVQPYTYHFSWFFSTFTAIFWYWLLNWLFPARATFIDEAVYEVHSVSSTPSCLALISFRPPQHALTDTVPTVRVRGRERDGIESCGSWHARGRQGRRRQGVRDGHRSRLNSARFKLCSPVLVPPCAVECRRLLRKFRSFSLVNVALRANPSGTDARGPQDLVRDVARSGALAVAVVRLAGEPVAASSPVSPSPRFDPSPHPPIPRRSAWPASQHAE